MYTIGIITAQNSLDRILTIDSAMKRECNITYLQYSSTEHLKKIYKDNSGHFDAFLFSSSFPYRVVCHYLLEDDTKPHAYFTLHDRDYYRCIAKISVAHPGINFSRVAIDTPEIEVNFEAVFKKSQMPVIGSPVSEPGFLSSVSDVYQKTLNYYLKLWNDRKIDFIVTRYDSLISELEHFNIPYESISPSRESMLETFCQLLLTLYAEKNTDRTTSFCLISPVSTDLTKTQTADLAEALAQCNKIFGMNFIIHHTDKLFELTTTTSVLKDISNQYTVCPVESYLKETLDFPVCIGWGSAVNAINAYQNAARALKESRHSAGHPAFIVTADNHIIGPLSSKRRISYTDSPDKRILEISGKVGLTPLCLRKIISVLNQKDTNDISAEELAYYLDVTPRSASRMLSKLVEGGAAIVSYNRQMNLRGRPAKIYTIDFGQI